MIPLRLQLFAVLVLCLFLAWVVRLIRQHRLSLTESLSWFLSTSIALLFTLFPQLLSLLSKVLGIELPSNALFALAFLYVSWNLLALTLTLSTQTTKLRRVVQECAVLRAELEQLALLTTQGAALPPADELVKDKMTKV